MDTAARMPGKPAFASTDFRVGDHVHQLLNLAAALVRAATAITAAADARAAETVVLEDQSAGISVSSAACDDASPLPGGRPFGLDLGSLSQAEFGRCSQDLWTLLAGPRVAGPIPTGHVGADSWRNRPTCCGGQVFGNWTPRGRGATHHGQPSRS